MDKAVARGISRSVVQETGALVYHTGSTNRKVGFFHFVRWLKFIRQTGNNLQLTLQTSKLILTIFHFTCFL